MLTPGPVDPDEAKLFVPPFQALVDQPCPVAILHRGGGHHDHQKQAWGSSIRAVEDLSKDIKLDSQFALSYARRALIYTALGKVYKLVNRLVQVELRNSRYTPRRTRQKLLSLWLKDDNLEIRVEMGASPTPRINLRAW